jgi:diguanylate cyclase (GGDEF)-like protein
VRPSESSEIRSLARLLRGPAAAALAVFTLALAIVALLQWSTASVDELSRERQHRLAANVMAQSAQQVTHDQESVTVWDDSINRLRETPLDPDWLDNNLGVWLHDYYGHDAAYVLDPAEVPLYAMVDGERAPPGDFAAVADVILPLVRELRRLSRAPEAAELPADQLSQNVTEILMVDGHLAIASVNPIISDSGNIEQEPGSEFVHVAVRRLDPDFAAGLRETFRLAGARFTIAPSLDAAEDALPLRSADGRVVGYFAWRPFAPGSAVFARLAPVMLAAAALVTIFVFLLMRRIARRTVELQQSNAAVQHLAFHDVLTGLPNRALFEDRLNHALAIFRRTAERRVALLFLDLDRFKMVNDTLGHAAGDTLIREFAQRLAGVVRATDTAARLGGDEFAIIQTDIDSVRDIDDLCARIIEAAAAPFVIDGSQLHVGVSIGVALAGKDGLTADELGRRADIALYEVKAAGRGSYRLFTPAMDEPIRARRNAERDLRAALEAGDQLSVAYQPTYSATSGTIVGVEALIRWQHPELGDVPPAVFIPVAEEIGLIEPLGEWVLAQACRDARQWPIATISVNVSPVQLRNPHFATRAIGIIGEAGIEPERIEIEITETAVIDDAGQCAGNLRLLRAFGARVALDDFGTGYSSFSHFNKFEVDRVKIDRTFVDKIDIREGGSAIIQAIVELARSSGFRTTAEGVETDEQKDFLERIGCDDLQGFLLARPIAAAEIEALLAAGEPLPGAARATPRAAA